MNPAAPADAELTARWDEVLDRFEASLQMCVALATAVHDGGVELPSPADVVVPDDLGPLPRSLSLRLQELTTRSHLIENELTRTRDEIAIELASLAHVTPVYGSSPEPSRLDEVG
jgi:hypothetical protein